MNLQNIEHPVRLFEASVCHVFDYASGIDIIDAVMNRYTNYADIIQCIRETQDVEGLNDLKEAYQEAYDPAQDLQGLRLAVMTIYAAANLYDAIVTAKVGERVENEARQSRARQVAYDALKKDYDTLRRMFEIEKQANEALIQRQPAKTDKATQTAPTPDNTNE
ncbi:hypothetical protein [uncultured Alistipes sp.]|uniref:hypothetical protein n=1 Tax=uncultured Alistipes sp. TaxID=538949 RepID=UPI002583C549|nr:hypothetical protein [uncultured Alistipes sp.]